MKDPDDKTIDKIREQLRAAAANRLQETDSPIYTAGLLLVAEQKLDELAGAVASLTRSVARAVRVEEPTETPTHPTAPNHRHTYEGEPPVCSCGKKKGLGGRPRKTTAERPSAEERTEPLPLPAAPAAEAAPKPKLVGAVAADRLASGPI